MWSVIQYLEASNELVEDKANLRYMGLTEEELEGYEEFFFESYYPKMGGQA